MSTTSSKTSEGSPPLLVAIVGPTAIGKSRLAVNLARRFDTGIINADSRQFYREMRIGTDKPSPEQRQGVPHYFLDDRSIEDPLTAGTFEKEALELLRDLFAEKQLLFMVGGSGLYVDALLNGLDSDLPPPDPAIREELNRTYDEAGLSPLLQELKEKDPVHFEKVDRKNPRRVIRALEVIRSSGHPYSAHQGKKKQERPFRSLRIGLWTEREVLHRRIAERVDEMLAEGLLDEVRKLFPYRGHQALRTVGYQELFPYLEGRTSFEEAREELIRNTRRYAKRQMTWFRRAPWVEWYRPEAFERIAERIEAASGLKARPAPTPSDT